MVDFPTEVHYSYRKADVREVKFAEHKAYGNFVGEDRLINIATDVPDIEQGNTFLHEYFHFVANTLHPFEGLPHADAVEERLVRIFSGAVSELIQKNPEAFCWMVNKMQGGDHNGG